ncbi:MAG: hypothetical protein PHC88_09300 [Terrimicrobiaceae bacterium]|nr:hypothetical protein [Terrimicrobiaceae bacterium]
MAVDAFIERIGLRWIPQAHFCGIVIARKMEVRVRDLLLECRPSPGCRAVGGILFLHFLFDVFLALAAALLLAGSPRHAPITTFLHRRMQRLVNLPRLQPITAQQVDAEQCGVVASRVALRRKLTFQQPSQIPLLRCFRRELPFAIAMLDPPPDQRLETCRPHDGVQPAFACFVRLARAPHPASRRCRLGVRKFFGDEQRFLMRKRIVFCVPHGFADGSFAEVEGPDGRASRVV